MGLRQLYTILSARFPNEIIYKNNFVAASLLLAIDLREAYRMAAENYASAPGNPAVVSTYAFALHLQGWDKQGIALLKKLPSQDLLQPSVAFYYGILLAAADKHDLAKPWLDICQAQGRLLPEEHVLLDASLQ